MIRIFVGVGVMLLAAAATQAGCPGHGCRDCRSAAHTEYPGSGCGPRVYGPCHEPVGPIDQCDACARFHGCHGGRQGPEWLAPWQLPPGRGFRPPQAFGYLPESCAACAACSPRAAWPRAW